MLLHPRPSRLSPAIAIAMAAEWTDAVANLDSAGFASAGHPSVRQAFDDLTLTSDGSAWARSALDGSGVQRPWIEAQLSGSGLRSRALRRPTLVCRQGCSAPVHRGSRPQPRENHVRPRKNTIPPTKRQAIVRSDSTPAGVWGATCLGVTNIARSLRVASYRVPAAPS